MDLLLDFFLHLDVHLEAFVSHYGLWVYGLLFLIIFAETGLVVTPFLPGDSLLFTAGALARDRRFWTSGSGGRAAAGGGDPGRRGELLRRPLRRPARFPAEDRTSFWHRLLNRDHLMKAHAFFERHGGKAIVLGRFVPIIRTFVPFVAGCGSMSYPQFAFYNVTGGLLWVGLCVGAGYAFGNMPVVKENFELVVVAIVFISLLPIAWGYLISRLERDAPAIVKAKEL